MIPARIYTGNPSPGEKEIFRRLENDLGTHDWIVLHSLDIAEHIRSVSGEADFVILVPGLGVLCLEVKAAKSVRCTDGIWYYGSDSAGDPRGPFKQASEAMHSIRRRVVGKNDAFRSILFWSAVAFPYVSFDVESSEWHSWQVIDADALMRRPLGSLVTSTLEQARNYVIQRGLKWWNKAASEPTHQQISSIAALLRPNFEVYESPRNRVERLNQEVKRYTEEQYVALDAMLGNDRVIFSGPAGTGKTLLAIEAVRRSAGEGKRTLLLCFNSLLGRYLEAETEVLGPLLTTRTLHKYMLEVAGIDLQSSTQPSSFWQDELPRLATNALLESEKQDYVFDQLVVDEAQDSLRDNYLDVLDLSLRGGLGAGKWILFGDFEKQAIYSSNEHLSLEQAQSTRLGNAPIYSLRINCRNTPRIAALVHIIGGLSPEYTRILRPDEGPEAEPKFHYYATEEQQAECLVRLIKQLRKDGFKNGDIAVLSARAAAKAIAHKVAEQPGVRLKPFDSASGKDVSFGSIHSFKGLEKPAVIVTDVEKISYDMAASLLYVAMTRALHRLHILAHRNVREYVLKLAFKE